MYPSITIMSLGKPLGWIRQRLARNGHCGFMKASVAISSKSQNVGYLAFGHCVHLTISHESHQFVKLMPEKNGFNKGHI